MTLEDIRTSYYKLLRDRWRPCHLCCGTGIFVDAQFNLGAGAEPAVGEVLTGVTSGATGIVSHCLVTSGTVAGADLAGYVYLSSPTGIDSEYHWGTDDEVLTGSIGTVIHLVGHGERKVNTILYPERDMVKVDEIWYCRWHEPFAHDAPDRDEIPFEMDDEDMRRT